MSWFGWLFVLGVIYLAVVAVRGVIHLVSWAREEFFAKDWEPRRRQEEPEEALPEDSSSSRSAREKQRKKSDHRGGYKKKILLAAARITLAHWVGAAAEFIRMLLSSKKYDYWVGAALGEEDPNKKVKYLSKALALDPSYVPAWGLKGDALLALQRYEEAIGCFDKVLEMDPDAATWYWKGLCCFHLRQMEQAIGCFNKTLAARTDRKLREDALSHKKLAEAELLTRTGPAADRVQRVS
jgi:tetratricopeptide (TPR) repeat protein